MDPRDAYEALDWAVDALGEPDNDVDRLYMRILRDLRDAAKKEAGR